MKDKPQETEVVRIEINKSVSEYEFKEKRDRQSFSIVRPAGSAITEIDTARSLSSKSKKNIMIMTKHLDFCLLYWTAYTSFSVRIFGVGISVRNLNGSLQSALTFSGCNEHGRRVFRWLSRSTRLWK